MNEQELLRRLIDLVDEFKAGQSCGGDASQAELEPVDAVAVVDVEVDEPAADEPDLDKMVSPLQQQLELLKKSAGVPSVFDGDSAPNEMVSIESDDGEEEPEERETREDFSW